MEGRATWTRLRRGEHPGELTADTLHVKAVADVHDDGTDTLYITFHHRDWTDIHQISLLHSRTPVEYAEYVEQYSMNKMPRAVRYVPFARDWCLLRLVWLRLCLNDVFPSEVFAHIASYLVYAVRECLVCDRWLAPDDMLDWDFARCKKCVKRRKIKKPI